MKNTTFANSLLAPTLLGLIFTFGSSAMAQDDHWNGANTPAGVLWNNPANWSLDIVPPSDTNAGFNVNNTYAGNVWLDPANGDSEIVIPAGDVENPGVPLFGEEHFNTIFGPEFGCTLDIYGELSFDWTIAPYAPNPAARSHINMWTNSYMHTIGASLNLGSGWWPVAGGCYVTMNMYDNARYSSLGTAGWWWGGHLNIYDNATALFSGYVNTGGDSNNRNPVWSQNDGTRSLVLGGGTLKLPEGFNTSQLGAEPNWITRGLLRPYGKGYSSNDLVIADDGTNTIVTVHPLGGALQRVYFQDPVAPNVSVGAVQQLTLSGDYPNVTGALLSSTEPGLDPATFPHPVYTSSNPHVLAVDTNGVVTALRPGQASISATVGAFTSTNTATIHVSLVIPVLLHRYSFTNSSGTTVADSVGGATYAAQLVGGATLGGGNVTFDGSTGFVRLPGGMLSNLDEISIETWASFGNTINPYACLFFFGFQDPNSGFGADYLNLQLDPGNESSQLDFGQGLPGINGQTAAVGPALDGMNNVHIVGVYHPTAGVESLYINGALAATQPMFNTMSDPVAFVGPTFNRHSILNYTLGPQSVYDGASNTPDCYIGNDNVVTVGQTLDPTFNGAVSEFRIYGSALSAAQVKADYLLGAARVIGANPRVNVSAAVSNGNIVLTWPITSAYVSLVSSASLGASAVWSAVTNGSLAVVGSNYQETLPLAGASQFFGLQ